MNVILESIYEKNFVNPIRFATDLHGKLYVHVSYTGYAQSTSRYLSKNRSSVPLECCTRYLNGVVL